MTAFALLISAAAIAFGLARWLGLPPMPFLLLAGWTLGLVNQGPEDEGLRGFLQLGITLLVFISGVELSPSRFARQRKVVFWIAAIQFTVVGFIAFIFTRAMGFDATSAVYLGFGLSASSTLVVIPHLKRNQQMFEPFGRTVSGVLLVQDVIMIVLIVALSHLGRGGLSMLQATGASLLLGLIAWTCHRFIMPHVVRRWKLDDERLLITVMALLFVFLGLAQVLQLPMIAGAFCAGFALAGSPTNGATRGLLGSLGDFFNAVFFTALGALIYVPDFALVGQALVLALLVFMITVPLVTLIGEWQGLTARSSIESGLLLAQTSEYSLLLGLTGFYLGHVDAELFSLLALTTAITITATPFLATDAVTWKLLRFHPNRHRFMAGEPPSDHILILGFGSTGMWVVKPLLAAGHNILVVDDDPSVIAQLERSAIPCLRGDGSDPGVLHRAGAHQAKLILAAMRRPADSLKVLRFVSGVTTLVRVFENADAELIREAGGIPVLNSQSAAETLMQWLEEPAGKISAR